MKNLIIEPVGNIKKNFLIDLFKTIIRLFSKSYERARYSFDFLNEQKS